MPDNSGPAASIMPLIAGYVPARLVFLAAELGIVDLIANGTTSVEDLAQQTGMHGPSLKRMLRALSAYDVFAEKKPGQFELRPMGEQLRSGVPGSLRNFARFYADQRAWKSFEQIEHTLRTGETAMALAFGMGSFEWFAKHPKEAAIFNAAMADVTRLVARSATASYDFSTFRTILDVGGGNGAFLAAILGAVPASSGMLFDLPAGLGEAEATLRAAGVAERCKVITGDFFLSVPAGADLMILKSVIHDWDDEHATTILARCRTAASSESRMILVERVMPECMTASLANQRAANLDMRMLTITGGIERTEHEYRLLLKAAGFRWIRTIALGPPSDQSVLEAVPQGKTTRS